MKKHLQFIIQTIFIIATLVCNIYIIFLIATSILGAEHYQILLFPLSLGLGCLWFNLIIEKYKQMGK